MLITMVKICVKGEIIAPMVDQDWWVDFAAMVVLLSFYQTPQVFYLLKVLNNFVANDRFIRIQGLYRPPPDQNHISCARTLRLCVARSPQPIFDPWPPIRVGREQMQKLWCGAETINIQMVPSSREPGYELSQGGSLASFNDLLRGFITIRGDLRRFRRRFYKMNEQEPSEVSVHINVLIHYSEDPKQKIRKYLGQRVWKI